MSTRFTEIIQKAGGNLLGFSGGKGGSLNKLLSGNESCHKLGHEGY